MGLWAAKSASKLHPPLGPVGEQHVTRIEPSDGAAGTPQFPLI
jgi:hypothetical protein